MGIHHGHRSSATLPLSAHGLPRAIAWQGALPAVAVLLGALVFAGAITMAGWLLLRPADVSFAWLAVAACGFLASAAVGVILLHCQRHVYLMMCAAALLVGVMRWLPG